MYTAFKQNPNILFNPALIDQDLVDVILQLGTNAPEDIALVGEVLEHYQAITNAERSSTAVDDQTADILVRDTIAAMKTDEELAKDIASEGEDKLSAKLKLAFTEALDRDEAVIENNFAKNREVIHEFFRYEHDKDATVIYMDGEVIMETRGEARGASEKAVQTFWVVLDVMFVLYAIFDLPQCKPAKDAVTKLLKQFWSLISGTAGRFVGAIKSMLPALKVAKEEGKLLQAVKAAAKGIANGVVAAVKFLWNYKGGLKAAKNITLAVLHAAASSVWKALYYAGQFILGVLSLLTGVGAFAKKVIALVSALAALVFDSIELSMMKSAEPALKSA